MKTRDRIVHAALELFNEHGERSITTNHIAAHIEISPGNLYYHFRNKQEIVREIFALYSAELIERFTPWQRPYESLTLLKHYFDSIFTLMWKYRFFYANLPEILQRDEQLHEEYIQVQEKLRENLVNIMQVFVEMQLLALDSDEMKKMVTTLHLIASSWLTYQSAMSLSSQITESVIHQGMLQIIAVMKSNATEQGLEQLQLLEDGVRVGIVKCHEI
ncbi:TetR/AcrR family transcriptional regulator [Vibrio cincinnatiensis]|jgi:AcrR family transcriptional regulator|uniref:Transcriptional regulator, TetR family n=1 Tax=Vibrio cincinnatiensis DSM 19608 TaxID=1123491 RepID=A0A1T4S8Y5_VIBCI|nr:TetR/AcrR family transcriptional regulator [Vibrio cincinnatiensis]MCG3723743.1 TetR/AcrR family transcriptional regulator [Vibrio cincinnatiensis]MCG3727054.1 TetR/AcrR family transcriptional regulator [Vibrio cincinnatiensis]MCG3737630.1 TetR/AcrR family transcriptional regulator [Vibrio cincinnatiensis]MCG3748348.1 TetR/AcrR family transcriptional regulator [Vibrio cincinnatiensis]SKA24689.1 transcriptional regulator, TetR family [Vibrio cincinnatiensis DSM 19608]